MAESLAHWILLPPFFLFGETFVMEFLRHLLRNEDGPTAVEYAVLLALIVVVCIGSIRLFGNRTAASFEDSSVQLNSAMSP